MTVTHEPPATPPVRVTLPWVESPFFERELDRRRRTLTPEQLEMAETYHRDGYLALPGIVPGELCDQVRAECEPFFEEQWSIENRRIQDAWTRGARSVRDLALFEPVLDLLRVLYERRPIPFQTLDFKWGTEQSGHSDSIHFSCLPARYMCGIWVALEDVGPDNGPLFYYPGSHRLPEIGMHDLGEPVDSANYADFEEYERQLMAETGIEPREYHAKKGDALVWCSNIVHGGRPVRAEGTTRWSQVTHVYFEDCVYYTPVFSDVPCGELMLKSVVDLATLEPVEHRLYGRPVRVHPLPSGRSRVSAPPPGTPPEPAGGTADEAAELRGELSRARAELAELRSSASFRVGHAALEPLRRLRRAVASER